MLDLDLLKDDADRAIDLLFQTTTKWDHLDRRVNCVETKFIISSNGDNYYEVIIGWVDPTQYDFRIELGNILYEMKEEYDRYDIEILTTW